MSPFGSMAQMASFDESDGAVTNSVPAGVHGQVVGRHARLQRGVHKDLPLRIDLEDGAAAVAHKQIALGVEGGAGGHAHAFGIDREVARRVHAVHIALGAGGHKQVAVGIEGQTGGIQNAGDKGGAAAIGAHAHHGDRRLLAARAGDGGVDHAGTADSGAGHRVQAVVELAGNAQRRGIGRACGGAHFNQACGGLRGHAESQARGPAHQHMRRFAVHEHGGHAEAVRTEKDARQLHFAHGAKPRREPRRRRGAAAGARERIVRTYANHIRSRCAATTL